jgi:AcrR family transcriptional regulator
VRVDAAGTGAGGRRRPARRGEGDRLQAEIIAAASRLLDESQDLGALSLRAVAREVGVATTSIYLHFADLAALVGSVKYQWISELREYIVEAGAVADDPVDRVRAMAIAYVRFGAERPGRYAILFSGEKHPPPPDSGLNYLGQDCFDILIAAIDRALAPGDDTALVATQLWAAMHGTVVLREGRPAFPWPDLRDQVTDLVDRLLRA